MVPSGVDDGTHSAGGDVEETVGGATVLATFDAELKLGLGNCVLDAHEPKSKSMTNWRIWFC